MKFMGTVLSKDNGKLIIKTDAHLSAVDVNVPCSIDIRPYRGQRSLLQNAKLWACLQELADTTGNDLMDIYITALEECGAKYEWIAAAPNTIDSLRQVFRAVKPFGTITTSKGQQLVAYKCFIGSSRYDTKEMAKLIDFVERNLNE